MFLEKITWQRSVKIQGLKGSLLHAFNQIFFYDAEWEEASHSWLWYYKISISEKAEAI